MDCEALYLLLLRIILHACAAAWSGVFLCFLLTEGQRVEFLPMATGAGIYVVANLMIHRRSSGRGKGL